MTPGPKNLLVQEFISSRPDWEAVLSAPPYALRISWDSFSGRNLLMLKYSQVDSDMSIPLVQECRGLILDADTFEVVSFPFVKFFNVQEPNAAKIDWNSARITEKIDGNLIKVVRLGNDLLISTNGTILADKAPVAPQPDCPFKTFGEIVREVFRKKISEGIFSPDHFRENFTYMFELTSPWTRVVVPHKENGMRFLGLRDNSTFRESLPYGHPLTDAFPPPRIFSMKSLDECISVARELPWDEEGYVVVDGDFNRVKVKSPRYLSVHHLRGDSGILSYRRAIEVVRANEVDEIVGYFPEFGEPLAKVKADIAALGEKLKAAWFKFGCVRHHFRTRKELAAVIMDEDCFGKRFSGIGFGLLDGKIESVDRFLETVPTEKLLLMLGYKERRQDVD